MITFSKHRQAYLLNEKKILSSTQKNTELYLLNFKDGNKIKIFLIFRADFYFIQKHLTGTKKNPLILFDH